MKSLIAYYSFTQNNEKLAKHLQKLLHSDIVKIETVKKRNSLSIMLDLMFRLKPPVKTVPYYLRDYDRVVFVAPIWAGRIATPLNTFLTKEKENIKKYSFVTLCGGAPGQKEKIQAELRSILKVVPENVIELWINNLLPAEKKNTVKYTSGYRIEPGEFSAFQKELEPLVSAGQLAHS